MRQNVAHTHILPHNHDEEKLLLGTPAEVQRTMLRTWDFDGSMTGGKGTPTTRARASSRLSGASPLDVALAAISGASPLGARREAKGAKVVEGRRAPRGRQPPLGPTQREDAAVRVQYPSCPTGHGGGADAEEVGGSRP